VPFTEGAVRMFFVILELTVVCVMIFVTIDAGPGLLAILNGIFIFLIVNVEHV
jgi:hypothetical protein